MLVAVDYFSHGVDFVLVHQRYHQDRFGSRLRLSVDVAIELRVLFCFASKIDHFLSCCRRSCEAMINRKASRALVPRFWRCKFKRLLLVVHDEQQAMPATEMDRKICYNLSCDFFQLQQTEQVRRSQMQIVFVPCQRAYF
eukprot:TRINITY_DN12378_c0_g1_i12.p7 TRINITY_DN12378_c0_g1~~TRINITY_DN12378_c0_g1_i12.p7  ORF type:complete len:140 (-),score=6.60 TRINITY_DN12378_c0_g1_i12:2288-2707(-)